jgi:hypothetical protein
MGDADCTRKDATHRPLSTGAPRAVPLMEIVNKQCVNTALVQGSWFVAGLRARRA